MKDMSEEALRKLRERLDPLAFDVLVRKGTERAFSGKLYRHNAPGRYRCVGCGTEVFDSTAKYDPGCGWPSFTAPLDAEAVETTPDTSHGMVRDEVTCSRCGGHLGHVFDDGPGPDGLRYCINSASLDFVGNDHKMTTDNDDGQS